MIEVFQMGGVMMWPLLLVGLGVLGLMIRGATRLSRGDADHHDGELLRHRGNAVSDGGGDLQSILFWGVVAAILGLLGTVVGLVQMSQAIGRFGGESVSAALVAGGFAVSLVTLIFGLLILIVALLGWYGLRQWESRRTRPAMA